MNHWLSIALLAYFLGAVIEGINAASQLPPSAFESPPSNDLPSKSDQPLTKHWHRVAAIASVSLCGAVLWPCRLIHRALKDDQA
ncbi:MAG: hypothetical protein LH647_02380 [Leptolyngbyaceae cyanobacterium CAN_BIN12]|nr:hypothetical protein [Leptolyngbyaceae cyanobacterium CAN_BIN12]